MIADRVMIKGQQAEFPVILPASKNKSLHPPCTYATSSRNMRKETAAKKKLCGLSLHFTGRYCFRRGLVEQIRSRRICDLAISFLSF